MLARMTKPINDTKLIFAEAFTFLPTTTFPPLNVFAAFTVTANWGYKLY